MEERRGITGTVGERHQRVDAIVTVGERRTFAKLARETRSRSNALIIQPESLWLASSTPGSTKGTVALSHFNFNPPPGPPSSPLPLLSYSASNAGKSHKPTFISI